MLGAECRYMMTRKKSIFEYTFFFTWWRERLSVRAWFTKRWVNLPLVYFIKRIQNGQTEFAVVTRKRILFRALCGLQAENTLSQLPSFFLFPSWIHGLWNLYYVSAKLASVTEKHWTLKLTTQMKDDDLCDVWYCKSNKWWVMTWLLYATKT